MTNEELAKRLHAYNASLIGDDQELAEEAAQESAQESIELKLPPAQAIENESIILRKRRPVLAIQNGTTALEFADANDGALWTGRLEKAKAALAPGIAAVGRVDLLGNPDFTWVGTAWLVHENILVTNRHVAEAFAHGDGDDFVFQAGEDGQMKASVDLLQEIGRADKQVFDVKRVRYIEERPGLDLAFLEVEQIAGAIAKPIPLSERPPAAGPFVATVGYPAFDSRIPEPDLMAKIYQNTYDKKRLAPGAITDVDDARIHHNCTTLGGNSGSVVLDLATGEALGLHFSGRFLTANFAVRADLVKQRLAALLDGSLGARRERSRSRPTPAMPRATATTSTHHVYAGHGSTSITIPLVVTVSLGDVPTAVVRTRADVDTGDIADLADDTDEKAAKPADYVDRKGYQADFLGKKHAVPLPEILKGKKDILAFDGGPVLAYEHFSVVMNEKRRMCFYSACNIDGARSKSSQRTGWRYDPRIPTKMQIKNECYGNSPKFSRGHMTRREDPAWGTTAAIIQRGADDSMHVTNATPQMQAFNAPIWLELEDYALQHARHDDQKISVFTGPYFASSDPTMYKVRIPVAFWKVIAFVHDKTKQLCATGYEMSQKDNLEEPEFVFGDFVSTRQNLSAQVAIADIERRAGLSFGDLADVDPLAQEGPAPRGPLLRPEQIRWI